jgi:hypothetical protein
MAILLDTNSQIRNFAPVQYLDPSARVSEMGLKLLPPFCSIPIDLSNTFSSDNPLVKYFKKLTFIIDSEQIEVNFNPYLLAIQSRPLFSAKIQKDIPNPSYKSMFLFIQLAQTKLISFKSKPFPDISLLAIASVRFWLAATTVVDKEMLIRQHMATLISVSLDRTRLEARYISEYARRR